VRIVAIRTHARRAIRRGQDSPPSGDIVSGLIVSGLIVSGDIVSGDIVSGLIVSGDIVSGDMVSGCSSLALVPMVVSSFPFRP
jgi:hypothetical protein